MQRKTVFVTGAAGGLGASAARLLASKGWQVFAADLDPSGLERLRAGTDIQPVVLDVTDASAVEAAREKVAAACDGLDGIVNFAGILAIGSTIEVEVEALRRVLDVNVLGMVRVNRALFPLVHARRGRIVNISSETGWQMAMPFNGIYAMSKHAVEAYSDALRRELMFLDVAVIKIQPGPFRTEMVTGVSRAFVQAAAGSTHFRQLLESVRERAMAEHVKAKDPSIVAEVIHAALTAKKARAAYSVRADPSRSFLHFLPTRLADRLLKRGLESA